MRAAWASAPGGWRPHLSWRRLGSVAPWLAVIALWMVFLRPSTLGGPVEYLDVRGDSMLPTLQGGDLVIVRGDPPYGPGDVVAYRVPAGELGEGRLVIHRLVGLDPRGGFVVQGDNNPAPDPWHPTAADIAGRAWVVIPIAGRILAILHVPAVAAALAVALLAAFAVWRPPRWAVSGLRAPRRGGPWRPWRAPAGRTG